MAQKKSKAQLSGEKSKSAEPTRRAVRTRERIPAEYTDPLHNYIQEMLQDPSLDEAVRTEKKEAYDLYIVNHEPVNLRQRSPETGEYYVQKLTLYGSGEFNELLRIADLSFKDYFEKIRFPKQTSSEGETQKPVFPELREDEIWLRDTCDNMDPDTFQKVSELAVEVSPKFWSAPGSEFWTPTIRALTLIQRQIQMTERRTKLQAPLNTPTLMNALRDRHQRTNVSMEDLLFVANAFHVSVHWLMMGDDKVAATARKPSTEKVLTAYSFMPKTTRDMFLKTVWYIDAMNQMWTGGGISE